MFNWGYFFLMAISGFLMGACSHKQSNHWLATIATIVVVGFIIYSAFTFGIAWAALSFVEALGGLVLSSVVLFPEKYK